MLYFDYFKRQSIWDISNIWVIKSADKKLTITKNLNLILSKKYESVAQKYISPNKILNSLK
jgi:hypothetical protein